MMSHPLQDQPKILGMLFTMVTGKIKDVCRIPFQGSDDLSHEVLIFIVVPVIGDTSRPLTESLAHILGIAGFAIKFWDVDLIVDSTFLLVLPLPCGRAGCSGGATIAGSLRTAITGLTLRPLLAPSPSTTLPVIFPLGSHLSHDSFIFRGVEGSSCCISWWQRCWCANHSWGSSPSN